MKKNSTGGKYKKVKTNRVSMDSSPEHSDSETVPVTHRTELKDRKLSNKGQFTIPKTALHNIEVNHKDVGVFLIDDIPYTASIYVTESGVRSTVDSAAQKALELQKGDTIDITLLQVLPTKESEVH